jgi:polysaccharide biosynthesis protein PslG
VKRLSPLAVVLAALALFGVGIGALVAAQSGGGATPAPAVAAPAAVLKPGKLPTRFFGMVSEDAFANPGRYRATTLNHLARMGVGILRETFDWASIERTPNRYDFTAYDGLVGSLAARQMTVLPVLLDPPRFRSSAPRVGAQPGTYPPKSDADMGRFAAALVRRYGPRGHFWSAHPELPKIPIRSWQIWNEPSLPAYWPSGPDPAQYTQMLERVGRSIRHLDPHADIVTAGIPNSRLGIPFDQFVDGMYKAGAKGAFDTLAIHPYAADAAGVGAAVNGARRIMDQNGDTTSRIWVTELGWADAGPASSFTVGAQGQAKRIQAALTTLYDMRAQDRLSGVVYFGWRDGAPYAPAFKDFWGLHTGLLRLNGTPKPALRVFSDTVATLRRQG